MIGMTPVGFGDCFGWLHQANGGGRGVVLCAATGYEALGSHQSWRVLADRLAAANMPTLRFDYPGYGDSPGDAEGPGKIAAAIESIRDAVKFLREQTGVEEIALIGLRLGAALAVEAAIAETSIDRLVLMTPVIRGKSFLVELKALAKVIAARGGANTIEDFNAGGISIEGFELDRDAIDAIAKIDLQSMAQPPARRILIVGEPGSTRYDALAGHLEALGCPVAKLELLEVAAWRPSAIPAPAPLEDIQSIVAWIGEGALARPASPAVIARGIEGGDFVESVLRFGEAGGLVGILCRPRTEPRDRQRQVLIFLNTGANHHIGSGRTMVEHARFLAARGCATLRMDCLGIGDSDWLSQGPLAVIHHEERATDVSHAIDALEALGFDDVCVAGVCSGAFLAFRSALTDARIGRLLLVNPQFWLPLSSEQLADARQGTFGATSAYVEKVLSVDAWRRVLRGEVNPLALLSIAREIAARRGKTLAARFLRLSKFVNPGSPLERELNALGKRGCQTLLVFSALDSALEIFVEHMAAANMATLPPGLEIETVSGADHVFATRSARRALGRILLRAMRLEEHDPSVDARGVDAPRERRVTRITEKMKENTAVGCLEAKLAGDSGIISR